MSSGRTLTRPDVDDNRRPSTHDGPAAVAGLIAVGAGLAVGELCAVPISENSSPFFAVGSTVVDHTPQAVREWAIGTFGTSDKTALFTGMALIIVVLAAATGVLERRRPPFGCVVIGVFAVLGVVAALNRSGSSGAYIIPSLLAGVVGIGVLRLLFRQLGAPQSTLDDEQQDDEQQDDEQQDDEQQSGVPRRFVLTAAGIAVAAIAVGAVGRKLLADAARTVADRAGIKLPAPASPAPPIPAGAEIGVQGATSYVTDNASFYRIDTALQVPQLTTTDWTLRVHGLVDEEFTLTWDELLAMPMTERVVTLTCVSNEVGGDLIGNARWLGVPMKTLLDRAGVRPGADMLLSTSSDGWTAGTPVSAITDKRDALLAVAMNGEPLPIEHGFPVRQVIPGLYGYVSATKWVTDWELTRFSDAQAYWTTRGWSALGPIKLASRIDRPAGGSVNPGEVIIAGTAWAQHTGISAVQVRIDRGPWQDAQLATEYSIDTWRQWKFTWQATSGKHTVECRAIDKNGEAQTETEADPVPDGATGLDSRDYTVG
ncbi:MULTISPECIES: molybdopterin-dependent oxidoreductase [Gordonia]|uniref:molybdopterin-dependent oxidoreductase n=1 Tax=Gordonia TaxID=2053 RepID=UPI002043A89C|nr:MULTISPECIES: molybdopterin-dependent oxidoreductase [Gordonia]MCM3894459.1 molybdopterin-dependent oxidoreductase [Gordonia sputi]